MKLFKYFTPILLSVSLCACGTNQTATVVQPITVENIAPTNVAKADTTKIKQKETPVADIGTIAQPTETPETVVPTSTTKANNNSAGSNAAVKDVIIDGNGNLVVSHSNGTFSSFAPLKGEKGDIGAKGDKGDRGADGIDGKDGRGIDHCQVDENNHLIVYYTDNTSQDAGAISFQIPEQDDIPEYEKVGYVLRCDYEFPIQQSIKLMPYWKPDLDFSDFQNDAIINSVSVKLINVNTNNPSKKYEYEFTCNYSINDWETLTSTDGKVYHSNQCSYYYGGLGITLDDSLRLSAKVNNRCNDMNNINYSTTFYSTIPYYRINNVSMFDSDGVQLRNK